MGRGWGQGQLLVKLKSLRGGMQGSLGRVEALPESISEHAHGCFPEPRSWPPYLTVVGAHQDRDPWPKGIRRAKLIPASPPQIKVASQSACLRVPVRAIVVSAQLQRQACRYRRSSIRAAPAQGGKMMKAVMSILGFCSPPFSSAIVALGGGWGSCPLGLPETPSDPPG